MTDLRAYLNQIKKLNELSVVKKKVSTKYEIAAITAKIDGGNAILFENIKESKFRLVANLVGTRARFAKAVNAKESNIHQKIIYAIKGSKKPKVVSNPKFMENRSKDLSILPIVRHFEKEPGSFITSSIIYTQNQETRTQILSF